MSGEDIEEYGLEMDVEDKLKFLGTAVIRQGFVLMGMMTSLNEQLVMINNLSNLGMVGLDVLLQLYCNEEEWKVWEERKAKEKGVLREQLQRVSAITQNVSRQQRYYAKWIGENTDIDVQMVDDLPNKGV
jgi:hypothetical protein